MRIENSANFAQSAHSASMLERGILRYRAQPLSGRALTRCLEEAERLEEVGREAEVFKFLLR